MTLVCSDEGSRTCRAVPSQLESQLTTRTDFQITVTTYSVPSKSSTKHLQLTEREPQASRSAFHFGENASSVKIAMGAFGGRQSRPVMFYRP
jgi:hypothetical protein